MPKPTKAKRTPGWYNQHFLSVYFEDETLKADLMKAAKKDGRNRNNFINAHIAPMIRKLIDEKYLKSQGDEEQKAS